MAIVWASFIFVITFAFCSSHVNCEIGIQLGNATGTPWEARLMSLLMKEKYLRQRLERDLTELRREVTAIKKGKGDPVVAFHVLQSDVSNLGENQVVKYKHILTNIGNGYKRGYFTAPVAGVYLFSFSVMSPPGKQLRLAMVKNGLYIAHGNSDPSGFDQGAQVAIVTLKKGDAVWIQHVHKQSEPIHMDRFNSFSGVLIPRNI